MEGVTTALAGVTAALVGVTKAAAEHALAGIKAGCSSSTAIS